MVKSFWNPESQKLFHLMRKIDHPVSSCELSSDLQSDPTKVLFYLGKFIDPNVGLVKKTLVGETYLYELVRPSYVLVLDGVTVVLVEGKVKVLGCVYAGTTCQENCHEVVGSDKCHIWKEVKKYTREQIGAMKEMLNGEGKKEGGSGGRKKGSQRKRK